MFSGWEGTFDLSAASRPTKRIATKRRARRDEALRGSNQGPLPAGFASALSLIVFAAGFAAAGFFDASATGASGAARNRASGEIDERYVARIRSGSLYGMLR